MCKRCLEAANNLTKPTRNIFFEQQNDFKFEKSRFVYFFCTDDLRRIKIGYTSKDPHDRMKCFQRDENQKLHMLATYPVLSKQTEKNIHNVFNSLRIHKRMEWFYFTSNLCGFLKGLYCVFHLGFGAPKYIFDIWDISRFCRV